MALTSTEILSILNESYEDLGWAQSGTNFITEANVNTIGVTSPNMRATFIDQLKLCLENRFWKALFNPDDNSARKFIVDIGSNGWGLLETYQKFLTGSTPMWDSSITDSNRATDLVTPVIQQVQRKYHNSPMSIQFKQTVNRRETEKLFTMEGMSEYINGALGVLSSSAEYWLLQQFIAEITLAKSSGDFVEKSGYSLTSEANIRAYTSDVRGIARDMELPSTLYNKDSILTSLAGSKVFYITDHIIEEKINVFSNATAFNANMADINSIEKIYIPHELMIDGVIGILLDKRAIVLGMRTYTMKSFMVANCLWENYWLSIEGIKSHSSMFNSVIFEEGVEEGVEEGTT